MVEKLQQLEDRGLKIVAQYKLELDQLEKLTKAMYTISEIRYILVRWKQLWPWKPQDLTQDEIHEIIVLQTALIVAYGRLFSQSDGTMLDKNDVPEGLKGTHDELIELRNKRIAHHDKHDSIYPEMRFEFDGNTFTVKPLLTMQMPLGSPEKTESLVDWIKGKMLKKSAKILQRLNNESRYKWRI